MENEVGHDDHEDHAESDPDMVRAVKREDAVRHIAHLTIYVIEKSVEKDEAMIRSDNNVMSVPRPREQDVMNRGRNHP